MSPLASADRPYRVGLVIPLQGPAGIFGPSCEAVVEMAAAEVNRRDGILGRPIDIEVIDGGAPLWQVAADVARVLRAGRLDALTGWHISSVRETLTPIVSGRVPYVYTSLYEGGERTPGVFCAGEIPWLQIAPGLAWLRDTLGLRRWFLVGDDYVWPHGSAAAARLYCRELGLELVEEVFVPFGTGDFGPVLERVDRSRAQAVLMLLVGQDAVLFNRQFAARELHDRAVRFSPLMEENMLLASGADATAGLYVAAAYFNSLATAGAMDLMDAYVAAHGPDGPPLNNAAESCYEGIRTLEALHRAADSADVRTLLARSDSVGYDGPRGAMSMRNGHLQQRVHLAVAEAHDFHVIGVLDPIRT